MRRISAKLLVCVLAATFGCKKEQANGSGAAAAKGDIVVGEVRLDDGHRGHLRHLQRPAASSWPSKEVNEAGGIKGRQVQVIALDDQGKPEEAATAVTRLISSDNVVALLGEVASPRSLAWRPMAQPPRCR